MADPAPSAAELANLSHHLSEITSSVAALSSSVASFRTRLSSSAELTYPAGISLLSLKNHLLLSYLHHLVSLFSLKLNAESIAAGPGAAVVEGLVKLRVVLEKIGPLEGKLKYQIEKLVRKADSAAAGGDVEDVINGTFYTASCCPMLRQSQILSRSDRIRQISRWTAMGRMRTRRRWTTLT